MVLNGHKKIRLLSFEDHPQAVYNTSKGTHKYLGMWIDGKFLFNVHKE